MWTAENRPRYNRDKLRYPSDLTDQEWAYVEPLIPPAKRGGGKRRVDLCQLRLKISHFCRLKISHFEGAVVPPDAVFGGTDLVEL